MGLNVLHLLITVMIISEGVFEHFLKENWDFFCFQRRALLNKYTFERIRIMYTNMEVESIKYLYFSINQTAI